MSAPQPTDQFSEAVCILALALGWLVLFGAVVEWLLRIVF